MDNFEDYHNALSVGEEAPSIPAPGPEFELDPEQFAPANFELDPEELNPPRVDPPATSQASSKSDLASAEQNQPAVDIQPPEESAIGVSGTTNEDENNNKSVTDRKASSSLNVLLTNS